MKTALLTLAAFSGLASASPVLSGHNTQGFNVGMGTSGIAPAVATITIDLSGIESMDEFGDLSNTVMTIDGGLFAENSHVIGLGWDVTIMTNAVSWLSDTSIAVENSDGSAGAYVAPGSGVDMSGTTAFSSGGLIDLVDMGFDFFLLADGDFRLEFFEVFDDSADAVDASFLTGSTLTIQYTLVPAPGALALMGLGGLVAGRRRR